MGARRPAALSWREARVCTWRSYSILRFIPPSGALRRRYEALCRCMNEGTTSFLTSAYTCITCHTGPGCPSQQREPLVDPPWEAFSLSRLTISLSEALTVRLETRATELPVPISHVVRDPGNGPVLPIILSRGDLCGSSPGGARGLQCWSSCTFAEGRLCSDA